MGPGVKAQTNSRACHWGVTSGLGNSFFKGKHSLFIVFLGTAMRNLGLKWESNDFMHLKCGRRITPVQANYPHFWSAQKKANVTKYIFLRLFLSTLFKPKL